MSIAAVILAVVAIVLLVALVALQVVQQKRFTGAFDRSLDQIHSLANRVEKQGAALEVLSAQSKELQDHSNSFRAATLESINELSTRTTEVSRLADTLRIQSETAHREAEQDMAQLRRELQAAEHEARNSAEAIQSVVHNLENLIRKPLDREPILNLGLLSQSNDSEWALIDHTDQVVAVLGEASAEGPLDRHLTISSEWKSQVQSLLKLLPNLAHGLSKGGRKGYVLRFTPEVAKGLQSGSLRLMPASIGGVHAIAVNQGGKIVEQGNLIQQSAVSAAAFAAIAWQILAAATSQHFLTLIDRNLQHVNQSLARILNQLDRRRIAEVRAIQNYVHTVSQALATGRLSVIDLHSWNTQLTAVRLKAKQNQLFAGIDEFFLGVGWLKCL